MDTLSSSGLTISYILTISGMAGLIFFPTITLVKAAVSLQRLEEYDSYKIHEKPFKTPKAKDDWP